MKAYGNERLMKHTVMIVDGDNKTVEALKSIDWKSLNVGSVVSCTSGADAVRMIGESVPDLMICGIRLSDMRCSEFIFSVRDRIADCKIIFYAAERNFDCVREALLLDAFAYVLKPSEKSHLLHYAGYALDGYSKAEMLRKEEELGKSIFNACHADVGAKTGDKIANTALELIQEHYAENISVGYVAQRLYVSESHLMHEMRRSLGVSFHECLIKCRIGHAKQLLERGDLKIKEVAYSVGISDARYFARIFKRETGMSPKEYAARYADS